MFGIRGTACSPKFEATNNQGERRMSSIETVNDIFTCRQDNDLAIVTFLKGAKKIATTVEAKEALLMALETIKDSREINGVAFIYSDEYSGITEYRQFLLNILEEKQYFDGKSSTVPYKSAAMQVLQTIRTYPKPIVGGMAGDIAPDSLGLNLALDLRIAGEGTTYFLPNLELGFPPSGLLSFYLVRSLGPHRATELMLTKQSISAQEALDLGLITQIVSQEDLENVCLDKLRQLSAIPEFTLVESRRLLQPDMDEVNDFINAEIDASLRCQIKLRT